MLNQWFSYRDVFFSREQNIFLIYWLYLLEIGIWPPEPQDSSYIEAPITKRRIKSEAYFTKPTEISGEIKNRLELTGVDGKLLKAEINSGIDSYELLSPESKNALNYISIFDFRKRASYTNWKKRDIYDRKVVRKKEDKLC